MRTKKISVWLFLFAGVLYVIAGLRDIFAPGFFNVSPVLPSKSDIAMQFFLAAACLASAALMNISKEKASTSKN